MISTHIVGLLLGLGLVKLVRPPKDLRAHLLVATAIGASFALCVHEKEAQGLPDYVHQWPILYALLSFDLACSCGVPVVHPLL